MNHRQTIQAVARHLPHLQRETVAEVLEVTAEVWAKALAQPNDQVTIVTLGKLYVEAQQMQVAGAVKDKLSAKGDVSDTILRLNYRFRPSGWLREFVKENHAQTQED